MAATRTQVVFGGGNLDAELMLVGEAPGADEDEQGIPFVGRSGDLLLQLINRAGFKRADVYICNTICCRPDMPLSMGNRPPNNVEIQNCLPFLREQVDIVQPKVIIALGATAVSVLCRYYSHLGRARKQELFYDEIPVIAAWHPAYVLRTGGDSVAREIWSDFMRALDVLNYEIRPDDTAWIPRVC